MMKIINKFLVCAVALALSGGVLTSCKSDDDNDPLGEILDAPKYEQYAAKYTVTDPSSEIRSLELTSAGNYIIETDGRSYAPAKKSARKGFFSKSAILTRSGFAQIIEGKYTVESDGTYNLEGYGKVKVVNEGETTCSLDIVTSDGRSFTLTAKEHNQLPNSDMTNNLCRTWNADKVQIKFEMMGKKYDKTMGIRDINKLLRDFESWGIKNFPMEDDDEDYEEDGDEFDDNSIPRQVIFSKAGTYMVKYFNNELAIATWSWIDEKEGTLRYSWDYDDMYDDDMAGKVKVFFSKGGMRISESVVDEEMDEDDYEGVTYSQEIIWHFVQ